MGKITIVGLGPGKIGLITTETFDIIKKAEHLLLRTAKHPATAELVARGIRFESYDTVYERQPCFEEVYNTIAGDVLARVERGENIVYAVPGSPLVAEKSVTLIRNMASQRGIAITVVPGISFLEVLYTRLAIDPITGVTIIDAADIASLPVNIATGLVITQVYNRQVASDAKLALMDYFPDEYQVTMVRALGTAAEEIRTMALYEMDRSDDIDHLTSIYVPPYIERRGRFSLAPLVDVMAHLRSPGGCVWDIEQTHTSLRRYILEEVHEVLEAIELADSDKLCEELGDLLLQIVFHARMAEESGLFSMQDVVDVVTEKMIRRHPHVFGDVTVGDAAEVVVNWEAIKKREKGHERQGVLDGIPPGLPSLMRAYKLQSRAAKVGFDWDTIEPIWDKIQEELAELKQAAAGDNAADTEGELGDVLFAVTNLARFLGIDPEIALNATNHKFMRRFSYIESKIRKQGRNWSEFTLKDLDNLWEQAKKLEDKEKNR